MTVEKQYYTAEDVAKIMGVSVGTAYKLIKQCNHELKKMGKITIQGKVNAEYFMTKIKV